MSQKQKVVDISAYSDIFKKSESISNTMSDNYKLIGHFYACFSESYLSEYYRVKICFIDEDEKKRIDFVHEISFKQLIQGLVVNEIKVYFPDQLIKKKTFSYFYYLAKPGYNNLNFEYEFEVGKKVRLLSIKPYIDRPYIGEKNGNFLFYKYDGYVDISKKLGETFVVSCHKNAIITRALANSLNDLFSKNVMSRNARITQTLRSIYSDLCETDSTFKDCFEKIIKQKFHEKFILKNEPFHDYNYVSLTTAFYYIDIFKINDEFHHRKFIIRNLNSNDLGYYNRLYQVFNSFDRLQLCDIIKQHLVKKLNPDTNFILFNLLLVLYSIENENNLKFEKFLGNRYNKLANYINYNFYHENDYENRILSIKSNFRSLFESSLYMSVLYLSFYATKSISVLEKILSTNYYDLLFDIEVLVTFTYILLMTNDVVAEYKKQAIKILIKHTTGLYRTQLEKNKHNHEGLFKVFCQRTETTEKHGEIFKNKLYLIESLIKEIIQRMRTDSQLVEMSYELFVIFCEAFEQIINRSQDFKIKYTKTINRQIGLIKQINDGLNINFNFMRQIDEIINEGRKSCFFLDHYSFEECNNLIITIKNEQNIKRHQNSIASIAMSWNKVKDKSLSLVKLINAGEIKLIEINSLVDYYGDVARIISDVDYYSHLKIDQLAKEKVYLYERFCLTVKNAQKIHEISQKLQMKPFKELEFFLKANSDNLKDEDLNCMTSEIEDIVQELTKMDCNEKYECLNAFTKATELIEWLRKNTKNVKELKFFAELMSESIDVYDIKPDYLSPEALKDAGTAFASLIYDYKNSDTFFEFMKHCVKVWSFVEDDKTVLGKFILLQNNTRALAELKIYKSILVLHSIKEVKNFNKNGIFKISNYSMGNPQSIKSIGNLLNIKVLNNNKEEIIKLEKLIDIKNLFILATAACTNYQTYEILTIQNKISIQYFNQIVNAVVALADVCLKFTKSGCFLFEDFDLHVYCDIDGNREKEKKPNLVMTFQSKIILKEFNWDSISVLEEILKNFNNMYIEWLEYVRFLRDKYSCLNYFTTTQLNYISKVFSKLVKNLKNDEHDFKEIKALLFPINNHLDKNLLKNVLFKCINTSEVSNEETVKQSLEDNLKNKLKTLWNKFMNFNDDTSMDFIKLTKLPIIFDELKDFEHRRARPSFLKYKGIPNLILCPESDQIATLLSIYAQLLDSPLPSSDEVLYCTKKTTSEEVENFLRLALVSNGNNVYTMINIHELGYDEATSAQTVLSKKQSTNDYNLVLICSVEKQEQCILASMFLRNKVDQITLSKSQLQNYIKLKFQVEQTTKYKSAAQLEPEKVCVRVLTSKLAGTGKTLFVNKLKQKTSQLNIGYKKLSITSKEINIDNEIEKLLEYEKNSNQDTHIYHIDISELITDNLDYFLFQLTILGCLKHSNGLVWRRSSSRDLYLIEYTTKIDRYSSSYGKNIVSSILGYLPTIYFRTPKELLYDIQNNNETNSLDMNFCEIFQTPNYQIVFKYMKAYKKQKSQLYEVLFRNNQELNVSQKSQKECLEILLEKSCLTNWTGINSFVSILSDQLNNIAINPFLRFPELSSLRNLFLEVQLFMASDFALPSININEENIIRNEDDEGAQNVHTEFDLDQMQTKRKWEDISHPYILFNNDRTSFCFMGFFFGKQKKLLDTNTGKPIEGLEFELDVHTYHCLLYQRAPVFKNFNADLSRGEQLNALRKVMLDDMKDVYKNLDPDTTYQLTFDNCLKIMAIYMRFRCNIPVIIMGETGCGKTSLIKFMCNLHLPKDLKTQMLVHVKVHGGITADTIEEKLNYAEQLSKKNYKLLYGDKPRSLDNIGNIAVSCILFYDEANTTDAVGLIKEIICDSTCNGRPIDLTYGLKIVAACNSYRKHSESMIKKIEKMD